MYLTSYKGDFYKIEGKEIYIPSLYFFKELILLKWMIEVERIHVLKFANYLEKSNHMLVYSINSNDILIRELTKIIQYLMCGEFSKSLKSMGLTTVPSSNYMNKITDFSCYEFELNDKKRYIIKIFDLENCNYLPSGLSTAYLNCKDNFESFGFMGVKSISSSEFRYLFLSVEEKPSFYLSTKDLGVFKNNVIQTFYFLLYFLELLNSLNVYKTELILTPTFAVDCSNAKKWRFRLEDVGNFKYFKNECLFRNHWHLILIIRGFLTIFEEQTLLIFLEN